MLAMQVLVTGVAGFIGSNLAAELLRSGESVRGVDCFTATYDPERKRATAAELVSSGLDLVEADLLEADLGSLVEGVQVVYHLAAEPGVRHSWADAFGRYEERNVRVTQRLLESVRGLPLERFVYASSSSVYGNARRYPSSEEDLPRPHSPYGVTKLAAEHLCGVYGEVYGVPTVSLRYFTVYGPRQRPDMLLHRVIEAALAGEPVTVYGSGEQVRDFTYVGDVVEATRAASGAETKPGTVVNVAGGSQVSVNEVLDVVGEVVGERVAIERLPSSPGDVDRTCASTELASALLSWSARTSMKEGVAHQVRWHRQLRAAATAGAD